MNIASDHVRQLSTYYFVPSSQTRNRRLSTSPLPRGIISLVEFMFPSQSNTVTFQFNVCKRKKNISISQAIERSNYEILKKKKNAVPHWNEPKQCVYFHSRLQAY